MNNFQSQPFLKAIDYQRQWPQATKTGEEHKAKQTTTQNQQKAKQAVLSKFDERDCLAPHSLMDSTGRRVPCCLTLAASDDDAEDLRKATLVVVWWPRRRFEHLGPIRCNADRASNGSGQSASRVHGPFRSHRAERRLPSTFYDLKLELPTSSNKMILGRELLRDSSTVALWPSTHLGAAVEELVKQNIKEFQDLFHAVSDCKEHIKVNSNEVGQWLGRPAASALDGRSSSSSFHLHAAFAAAAVNLVHYCDVKCPNCGYTRLNNLKGSRRYYFSKGLCSWHSRIVKT